MSNLFVDTSGWASLFISTQTYYPQAEQYFRLALQQKKKIYTTNYIITELVSLLNSPIRISRSRIQDNPLTFNEILSLKEAGLVNDSDFLNIIMGASTMGDTTLIFYGSLVLCLEREQDTPPITNTVGFLTKSGTELLQLISIQPDMDYLKFVAQKFNREGMKIAYSSIHKEEEGLLHIENKTYFNF
ncbi:MAG: hypothetical protein ACK596_06530 [Pseudanabaena sp.]|jgi:predicted nucleic-acid-binding protein